MLEIIEKKMIYFLFQAKEEQVGQQSITVLFVERNFPFEMDFKVTKATGRFLTLKVELTSACLFVPKQCLRQSHFFDPECAGAEHMLFNLCTGSKEEVKFWGQSLQKSSKNIHHELLLFLSF